MENASKALMIAGGILLAILTLTLVVYMMTAVTSMGDAQDAKALAKQIDAFNKDYDSYNKRRMYGTDIITVINKAINHNESIAAKDMDPYYININIETIEDFITTGQKVTGATREDMTLDEIKEKTGKTEIVPSLVSGTYELGTWRDEELNMHKNIINFFSGDKEDDTKKEGDKVYYIYSALTNFKKAIFECEEVIYNEGTGRIKEMRFRQIRSATH